MLVGREALEVVDEGHAEESGDFPGAVEAAFFFEMRNLRQSQRGRGRRARRAWAAHLPR